MPARGRQAIESSLAPSAFGGFFHGYSSAGSNNLAASLLIYPQRTTSLTPWYNIGDAR
jgi:hypothetical protein